MRPLNWMAAAVVAASLAPAAYAQADPRDELLSYVVKDAERDFDAVRGADALSGSVPPAPPEAKAKPGKKTAKKKAKAERSAAKHASASAKPAPSLDVNSTIGRP